VKSFKLRPRNGFLPHSRQRGRFDIVAVLRCMLVVLSVHYPLVAAESPCTFNGTREEEAKCLLRPVEKYGHLGSMLLTLPAPLSEMMTQRMTLSITSVASYVFLNGIGDADIGGPLTNGVSQTQRGERARYFIIHDTSVPIRSVNGFPTNINHESWSGNDIARVLTNGSKPAHVYIDRLGRSITPVDFKTPWRSTKYENATTARKGLFLSVELVQPRLLQGRSDAEGPVPGFTDSQLERLALVYIVASVRAGEWLVPAYHAAVDAGIKNGHDDPQNFDLPRWCEMLSKHLAAIKALDFLNPQP
jgi:hypothetical protein